jgi:hypothetical protein
VGMERAAAGALCATSSPAQPQRCRSHRQTGRQIIKAAPRQQPAARAAASSSGGGSGGRPAATPLAAALLSVVQVLAAFQLVSSALGSKGALVVQACVRATGVYAPSA